MAINIRYYLDKTYKDGVDYRAMIKLIKAGKPVKKYLSEKETAIYLGVTVMGSYFKIYTKEKIFPDQWDLQKRKIKTTHPSAFEKNILLDNLLSKVSKMCLQTRIENPGISFEEIKDLVIRIVNNNLPKPKSKDFFEVYEDFLADRSLMVKPLTMKKYRTLKWTLIEFIKKTKYNVQFYNVNEEFNRLFRKYLEEKELYNNTINKYYDGLKLFMKWAKDNHYHNNILFENFKAPRESTDVIYLTAPELSAIENLELNGHNGLDKVRNCFLFQCNTGQRFSDLKNLQYKDIVGSDEYGYEWHLFQRKGNKPRKVIIPLTSQAVNIFKKYRSSFYSPDDRVLPVISNVKMNKYIKDICKLAGITSQIPMVKYSGKTRLDKSAPKYSFISSHTARRTFVSLSVEKGMNSEVIMRITGHESYRTMKKYLEINPDMIRKEMLVWEKK